MEKFNFRAKKKAEDNAPENPTRRAFLAGGLAAAASLAAGSQAEARKKDPSKPTPRQAAVAPSAPEAVAKKEWTVRETRLLLDDKLQIDRAFLPLVDQGMSELGWILEDFEDEPTTDPEVKSLRERYPDYPEMKELYRYFLELKIEFARAQSEFKTFSVEVRWDEAQKSLDSMNHLLQEIQGLRRHVSLIPGNQEYLIEKNDSEAEAIKRTGSA